MTFEELKGAVETGHRARPVLLEVLQEMVDNYHCPEAAGFEGPDTFPDCGECAYCLAKRLLKEKRGGSVQ